VPDKNYKRTAPFIIKSFVRKKKWLSISILFVLVIVITLVAMLIINVSKTLDNNSSAICDSKIINHYNDVMSSGNQDELDIQFNTIVKNIESKPGYKEDSNCLFIMTNYYLNMHDKVKARESYNKFRAVMSSGNNKLSSDLNEPYDSESFDNAVRSLENKNGDRG